MLRKICLSTASAAFALACFSQDSAEVKSFKPTITASADVYYRYNLSNPRKDFETFNNFTSFTNSHNSFELGMARIKLEHAIGKVGMVAELGFGKRVEEFNYNDRNTMTAIRQLYVSYSPWENIKFTAGNWATHFNNEILEPDVNRNYSMSYMFTYGPFFHTGVKAEATLGKHGFMLGVANPNDFKFAPPGSKKYLLGQYSFSPAENFKAYLNYFSGQRQNDSAKVRQVEALLFQRFSDQLNISYTGCVAFNRYPETGKYGNSKNWWGSALYFNYDPQKWLGLTLRTEYFSDKNRQNVFAAIPGGGSVFETTLSANFRIDNLTIIPEFRLDKASKEIFIKHSGATTKSTGTLLLAAVYKL